MSTHEMDPYATLGIQRGASLLEIARARRRLAKQFHPDVARGVRSSERMRRVNVAWELLSDPALRAAWDARTSAASAGRSHAAAQTWTEWAYPQRPYGSSASTAAGEDRHVGWWVAVAVSLLLAVILGSGLIAALDGPDLADRDSPVVQNNLDSR